MSFLDPTSPGCEKEGMSDTRSCINLERKQKMRLSYSAGRLGAESHSFSDSMTSASSVVTSLDGSRSKKRSSKLFQTLPQYYRGNHGEVSPKLSS